MTSTMRRTLTLIMGPIAIGVLLAGLSACGSPETVSVTGGSSNAGASAQEPTPTTAAGPTEVLLSDLERLSSSSPWQRGAVKINTIAYENGVWATTPCHPRADGTGSQWDFDLNRQYNKLAGVVGLSDDSVADAKFNVSLVGDGTNNLGSFDLALGAPQNIDVPLTGVLRLTVKINLTSPNGGCTDPARIVDSSKIAFGDAKLIK